MQYRTTTFCFGAFVTELALSYGEVMSFIAKRHSIAEDKMTALRGRLQHFQRLGWPSGANLGRGTRVRYGLKEVMLLAMAFEMVQLGVGPERIVDAWRQEASGLARQVRDYLTDGYSADNEDPIYFFFFPQFLAPLQIPGERERGFLSLTLKGSNLTDPALMKTLLYEKQMSCAVISISEVIKSVLQLAYDSGKNLKALQEDAEEWVAAEHAAGAREPISPEGRAFFKRIFANGSDS